MTKLEEIILWGMWENSQGPQPTLYFNLFDIANLMEDPHFWDDEGKNLRGAFNRLERQGYITHFNSEYPIEEKLYRLTEKGKAKVGEPIESSSLSDSFFVKKAVYESLLDD